MGLLDLILGPTNPVAQFADQNRNWLGGVGAGIASGTNLGQSLGNAANYGYQGKQLDYQTNLATNERNQTAAYLHSIGMDDLVPLALGGDGAAALTQAFQRQQPGYGQQVLQPGDMIRDVKTGQMTQVGGRPLQPVGWGQQGFFDPNTKQYIPLDMGGGDSGAPLGTTGNSAIDPTADGYSSKPLPGTGGLTQAAIDQRALNYITSGGTPPVGRTGLAGIQNTAISNRMAEMDPTGNLASNRTQLKALGSSLTKQQTYLDQTERSINNAENGFQQVVNAFQGKVNLSQYPSINAAVNAAQGQLDPGTISAFRAGLQEVANEYAQVFSRGGQMTDAVRSRAQDIMNGNLSVPQLQQVLDELQAQGNVVIQGAKDQIGKINDQIAALGQGKSSSGTNAAGPTKTFTYNPTTGELE